MNISKLAISLALMALVSVMVGTSFAALAADNQSMNEILQGRIPDEQLATLRLAPLNMEPTPPFMPKVNNSDLIETRSYPTQPPLIPHAINNKQITLYVNSCLACHANKQITESQAPMIGISHYVNREGEYLAAMSPGRYFCTQCHVPQYQVRLLVENDFVDMDTLIDREANAAAKH